MASFGMRGTLKQPMIRAEPIVRSERLGGRVAAAVPTMWPSGEDYKT